MKRREPIGGKWRILANGTKDQRTELTSGGAADLGVFDELVINDLAFHLEQMSARHWWMQVGDAYCGITVRRDGKVVFDVRRGEYGPILGRTE